MPLVATEAMDTALLVLTWAWEVPMVVMMVAIMMQGWDRREEGRVTLTLMRTWMKRPCESGKGWPMRRRCSGCSWCSTNR